MNARSWVIASRLYAEHPTAYQWIDDTCQDTLPKDVPANILFSTSAVSSTLCNTHDQCVMQTELILFKLYRRCSYAQAYSTFEKRKHSENELDVTLR